MTLQECQFIKLNWVPAEPNSAGLDLISHMVSQDGLKLGFPVESIQSTTWQAWVKCVIKDTAIGWLNLMSWVLPLASISRRFSASPKTESEYETAPYACAASYGDSSGGCRSAISSSAASYWAAVIFIGIGVLIGLITARYRHRAGRSGQRKSSR
ncbi:hypothetical protein [Paracoccus sp. PAR01]|jgi:hypothetical protein|uniref:hypothetical protein n=1 Tax=Paracoccus sp. PAR01 TaxID=2769282 RepID=UPI00177F4671|nr:hypothetical protein [Paracoccus sp. PAR01]